MFLVPIAVALLIFAVFEPLFLKENGKRNRAVVWKTAATLCAAALAAMPFFGASDAFCRWIFIGILVSALSDAVIHFFLGAGALAFMAAHGCFVTAFRLRAEFCLPISAFLFLLAVLTALFLFRRQFGKLGKMLPVCLLYVTILSAMFSVGFATVFSLGVSALPIAAGALLFYVSDLLVAKNVFLSTSPRSEAIAMTTYYGAEFLFALAAFLTAY